MTLITTTQLRTQTTKLIAQLKSGKSVSLIHRSQNIGIISPASKTTKTTPSAQNFVARLKKMKPFHLEKTQTSIADRKKHYQQALEKKYESNLS